MKKHILKNLILFLVGLCIYTTIEVWFRGYSYRLMGLVGGCIMCVLDKINDRLSWDLPLICQMILGGAFVTVLELLSGEFALYVLGVRMWDYSGQWMSMCDNLICPLFSLIWIALSGVAIVLSDAINYYLLHDEQRPYYNRFKGSLLYVMPERQCCG